MRKGLILSSIVPDLEILIRKSPMTPKLKEFCRVVDFREACEGRIHPELRKVLKNKVQASQDPWTDVQYQALYINPEGQPEDRVVLQEPVVEDAMVAVMVLKAARLQGRSGMVWCGTAEQLDVFRQKLPEYEARGVELDEKEFLDCLQEAAIQDGLQVIFSQEGDEDGSQ